MFRRKSPLGNLGTFQQNRDFLLHLFAKQNSIDIKN